VASGASGLGGPLGRARFVRDTGASPIGNNDERCLKA
jgi:hypothetical protein